MRIDIDSVGYRPGFTPQKQSGENNELNNRGENVRGRVIDVNQNIVLIQTSTGKQFSATTVIPMENFIDQEMSFSVMVGEDGQLVLTPEIDSNNSKSLENLKILDLLTKLGKQLTPENKDIAKELIKASIPVTKENFEQAKELKFAMNLLKTQEFSVELNNNELNKNINELLKVIQNQKEFGVSKPNSNPIISQNVELKDLLLLKNLDLNVSPTNIKALNELLNKINSSKIENNDKDLIGIKNLINDKTFIKDLANFVQKSNIQNNPLINEKTSSISINDIFNKNIDDFSFEDMEKLNNGAKNIIFDDFTDEINSKKNLNLFGESKNLKFSDKKIDSNDILNILKNIESKTNKKIDSKLTSERAQDLKIDYNDTKESLKSIISILGKESEISKTIEKQISPKIEILSNMMEKYNYNVIPFKTNENYENTLQYYVKKNKKSLKKQDEINIGLSLDTNNYGTVKTMVNYNKNKAIKLDFLTENKQIKNLFDDNLMDLKNILKKLNFSNVDINVNVKINEEKNILEDAIYDENSNKSFNFYI